LSANRNPLKVGLPYFLKWRQSRRDPEKIPVRRPKDLRHKNSPPAKALILQEKACNIEYISTIVQPAEAVLIRREARIGTEYFPALTGVRFFLALWVILHHLVSKGMMLDVWSQSLPASVRIFLEQGHVAVRTFFVLSGFVLAHGYARSRWNRQALISYGVARFARVYPVYLTSLLVVSYFILEFLMSPGPSSGGKLETVAAYGLILQGWMHDPGAGWNTPAWSLSCEFLFYLCLPAILIWLGPRSRLKLAALVATALVLPALLHRAGVPSTWKPILHLGDFLAGIAVARIYSIMKSSGSRWVQRGYWLYLPAIAAGVLVVVFPALAGSTDPGTVLRPLNGMLVLGFALDGGALARFLSTTGARYLGQASYSMYILHVPLLWWFGNHGPVPLGHTRGEVALIYLAVIYIAGIVLISAACFQWVEKPANRWIRNWARHRLK
jgi:peptidoglycan/LPS O-acetylase OafA/YrhL